MKKSKEINLIPATNSFYVTSDCLHFIQGNRELHTSTGKIQDIESSMRAGDYIEPILVDEDTMSIVNGQHRYTAACNLWKQGIEYKLQITTHKFDNLLLAAIKYNSNFTRWTSKDYVNAYIVDGRESFALLENFIQEHPLFQNNIAANTNYMGAAQLLTGSACYAVIPRGTLVITKSQCKEADVIYKELEELIKITGKGLIGKSHILAYVELRPYIKDFRKFVKAMKKKFVKPKSSSKKAWAEALYTVNSRL